MTREEKLALNRERQKAVREAWERERDLCSRGRGTVDWTKAQQRELMMTGKVKGYEGQHMKSVSKYPQYAGDVNNIQLLSHKDHLAAHNYGKDRQGYQSPTNGFYNSLTGKIQSFGQSAPRPPKEIILTNPCFVKEETMEKQAGMVSHNNNQLRYKGRFYFKGV